MKRSYPVVFTPAEEGGFVAYIPDFKINTQGENLADAMEMAWDAIGLMGVDLEDEGTPLPEPSESAPHAADEILSFVTVDFTEYRQNCLPGAKPAVPAGAKKTALASKRTYFAVLEPAKTGGYGVYFPDLPGCTSWGKNRTDAQEKAADALRLHLRGMERDGDSIPAPSQTPKIDPATAAGFLVALVTA